MAASLAFAVPGVAQEDEGEAPTESETETPAAPPSNAPFMEPMTELARVMGSTLFLRQLCGADDAEDWRGRMNTLIESQDPGDGDRRRLIAGFNRGYRAFESTYRSCTPAAREAASRYRTEGMDLARDIAARFGN